MPRTKLDAHLPNTRAVSKLIERYIRIERRTNVEEFTSRMGISRKRYTRRMEDPGEFELSELRRFAKTLQIPQEELLAAIAEAVRY